MVHQSDNYVIYLLRLWRESDNGSSPWRALLECPHTGECRAYPSGDALLLALRERMEEVAARSTFTDE